MSDVILEPMHSPLDWLLVTIFLLVNVLLFLYFANKYNNDRIRTSLYWALTYFFFIIAVISTIIRLMDDLDLYDANLYQYPFVILGITSLAMSVASTGLFGKDILYEMIFGIAGLLAATLFFIDNDNMLTSILFITMSMICVISYFYLGYSVSNYRITVISIGLLVQGSSGSLATNAIINAQTQLIFNTIGQLLIGIGLIGARQKSSEE